ncbi:hypothetical protein [Paraliomyxa miuraensis]|uniref:hypothetical protein n=1 Tax=Paraliomyxa miuraensis TaxID=376150 RepID=UPI0022550344|nr:hypothetical protein [Paraliomyxa miuraensis]MCX4244185.1 hypothetical protein [Paraliomyxa miuraensis]
MPDTSRSVERTGPITEAPNALADLYAIVQGRLATAVTEAEEVGAVEDALRWYRRHERAKRWLCRAAHAKAAQGFHQQLLKTIAFGWNGRLLWYRDEEHARATFQLVLCLPPDYTEAEVGAGIRLGACDSWTPADRVPYWVRAGANGRWCPLFWEHVEAPMSWYRIGREIGDRCMVHEARMVLLDASWRLASHIHHAPAIVGADGRRCPSRALTPYFDPEEQATAAAYAAEMGLPWE